MKYEIEDSSTEYIVTFDGLINKTDFLKKVDAILKILQSKMKTPIDIEFVSNGVDFYLLQCRPQSFHGETTADNIPRDLPADRILFTANRHISNGKVPEITHVVYIDPQKYTELSDRNKMLAVGRAVGKLNKLLPKRKFILMGPGRWGSRGDIKLGVSVTYSDINNTAMLIEVARKKGNYVPDLSFGTHFFQDLVEANIRYLPLYPDDNGVLFNDTFLGKSKNIYPQLVPEYDYLEDTVKVIDISEMTGGNILKVAVNAEIDEAIGFFTQPSSDVQLEREIKGIVEHQTSDHWRWRMKMAEKIASELDGDKFGIKGIYVFGSTKNAVSGPGSDIDLIVHIDKNKCNIDLLKSWFDGWSLCLSEMNYLRTGYKSEGLLDIHLVTDEDIKNRNSYASKIGAVTDAARPLRLKSKTD
jgi:predicted nucleotidyltransferase